MSSDAKSGTLKTDVPAGRTESSARVSAGSSLCQIAAIVPSAPTAAAEGQDEAAKPSEGAEVVRLDRFRKK